MGKKVTRIGTETIKALHEAVGWTKGYRDGLNAAAEIVDAVVRNHGGSKVVRRRIAEAIQKIMNSAKN